MPSYGAKMGPEGGPSQVNATEALLLPGPGLKIEGDHAPTWRQDGPRRGANPMQLRLCCSRGLGAQPPRTGGSEGPTGPRV